MEVILLERVEKLGQMGDVVTVKDGFGRNYLLPQGKALRSNKSNLAHFEGQRAQLEAQNLERKTEAEAVAESLNGSTFIVIRQASEAGSLFGSVTSRDVADLTTEGGFTVDRGQIILDKPVKELGIHEIRVRLHPEVTSTIAINVARSQEEAELQAEGKTVAALRAEAEAEEALDVAALFEDMGKFDEDQDDDEADAPAAEASDEEEETK